MGYRRYGVSCGKLCYAHSQRCHPFRNQGIACWCRYHPGAKLAPCLAPPRHTVFTENKQICWFLQTKCGGRSENPSCLPQIGDGRCCSGLRTYLGGTGLPPLVPTPHTPMRKPKVPSRREEPAAHRYKDPPKQPYLTSCSSELNQ